MLKRIVSCLSLTIFTLSFSLTAFGADMTLTLNLPDTSPLEANAGPGQPVVIALDNTGKPSVNVNKITVFIAGTAIMDEDYEIASVDADEFSNQGVTPINIPHESSGGLQPNDISYGYDSSSIWINNWQNDTINMEFTLNIIADDFDDDSETIEVSINSSTPSGSGSSNVSVNESGNGSVTIVDDDDAGIVVTNSGAEEILETAEDNTHNSFDISLTSQPYPETATVVIPLSKVQTGADPVTGVLKVGGVEATQVTLNKDNWNSGVTVVVESGGGTSFDEDEAYTVVTGDPTSAQDAIYDAFTANDAGDVKVVDLNNDSGSILQIDSGFLAFEAEEGDTVEIPVERSCSSACTTDTVTVKWKTVVGTADASEFDPDPADPNGTLEWLAGDDTNKTMSITISADDVPDDAMSFTVVLYDPVIGTLNDSAKVSTVTIPENDALEPGTITVDDVIVNEAVGNATITLKRVGGSDRKISLDWVTVEGDGNGGDDATTPEDYADNTAPDTDEDSGNVSWDGGDMADKTFQIAIVDDTDTENDEFFRISFSLNTGGGETDPLLSDFSDFDTEALVTILANDATDDRGTVVVTNAQVVEGNPGDNVTVVLTAERIGGTDGPINVTWMTADGDSGTASENANSGTDYEEVTNGTFSWGEGEVGTKQMTVQIVEDTTEEPAQFFKVSLAIDDESATCDGDNDPAWCALDAPTVQYPGSQADHARVDITDDDAPGDITVVGAPVLVGEGAGNVTVTLNRGPGTQGDISVHWETADGNSGTASENAVTTGDSADGEADYTTSSGDVSWDNVGGDMSFDIPIDNDDVVEDTEGFRVLLTLNGGSDVPGDMPSEIAIQIIDNDSETASTITVPTTRTVSESSERVNITVQREGTDGVAWVNYNTGPTNPVSATSPDQYEAVVNGQVQFADGQSFATATVNINIDDNDENQKFLVVFSKPATNNDYDIINDTTEVSITDTIDNNSGEIVINPVEAVEGSPAKVILSRVNGTKGEVILNWTMTDGTAKSTGGVNNCAVDENSGNDNDYTRTANGTVTWPDSNDDVKEILIPTLEDECVENTENFSVSFTLDDESESVSLSTDSVDVNIIDNDGGGSFRISDNTILENQKNPELLVVERLGGTQGFVFMEYHSEDGTAQANGDYYAISGSLTWNDGDDSPRYLTTTIPADTLKENQETFTVVLSNLDSERPVELLKSVGTVTILDPYSVPTLSQWSLMVLLLLVGWIGFRNLQVRTVKLP